MGAGVAAFFAGEASAGAYAAAASLTATGAGAVQQHQAAGEQKKALREQQRISDIKNQREVREQIRQERIKRATILQSGENVGAAESSGVLGGAASVTSQAAGNISFLDSLQQANMASSIFASKAADYQESASLFKGTASIFSAVAGVGGFRDLGTKGLGAKR